jgi:CheY-like chemotaxis protein
MVKETDRSLKILIVEDHEDTALFMSQLLKMRGHHVAMAGSVEAALALSLQQPFDLVISDLGLPDGSGLDLIRRIHRENQQIKAIALSGYGRDEDIRKSRDAGFIEHLIKPVSLDQLQEAISRVAAE